MATIVTYNRGAQGTPVFDSKVDDNYIGKTWEFLGDGVTGFTVVDFAAQAANGGKLVNADTSDTSSFISLSEVFADLEEGKEFMYLVRTRLKTRASGDTIGLGIAEDVAGNISATATHCGFEVACGAAPALDSVKVCYEDATSASDLTTQIVATTSDALADFDCSVFNEFGFLMKRKDGKTSVDYYVNGALLASRSPVTTVFGDELFLVGRCAAGGGDWEISRISVVAPR